MVIPFIVFIIVGECEENNYHNVFNASIVDKYERLESIDEPKIVFVGGSSLPFGLRSDLIEKELDKKVVDFGVYASLGTKAMLEFTYDNLYENDILVIAPELNEQTYSMYFNAHIMWESINEKRSMIFDLSYDEMKLMGFNYLNFLYNKLFVASEEFSTDQVYSRTNFNEYGDLVYERDSNIMPGGYDKSMPITLSNLMNDEFFDYLSSFISKLKSKGVTVYFTFSPSNILAIDFTDDEYNTFQSYLKSHLDCQVISSIKEMTYDSAYFYNTNFHLNNKGAILHTVTVINALKKELGIDTPTNIDIPEIEEKPDDNTPPDITIDMFNYRVSGNNIYLTSIKDEYKDLEEIRLPEDPEIIGLDSSFLSGCNKLKTLIIPKTYSSFDIELFSGCPLLEKVYLETENPGQTYVPATGLMDNSNEGIKLYIKASLKTKFLNDYTWRNYKKYFVTY